MSEQQKIRHFQRLFDEYELRGGEGFSFAEWLAEIKVPELEAKLADKTKQFRAFREARIGHDYITHTEQLESENEALREWAEKHRAVICGYKNGSEANWREMP